MLMGLFSRLCSQTEWWNWSPRAIQIHLCQQYLHLPLFLKSVYTRTFYFTIWRVIIIIIIVIIINNFFSIFSRRITVFYTLAFFYLVVFLFDKLKCWRLFQYPHSSKFSTTEGRELIKDFNFSSTSEPLSWLEQITSLHYSSFSTKRCSKVL